MIGAYRWIPCSLANGPDTCRAPGTTTAPSGIVRGSSGVARWVSSRIKSYTAVDEVSCTPGANTARSPTTLTLACFKTGRPVAYMPINARKRIGKSKISGTVTGTMRAGYKILKTIFAYRLRPPRITGC